MEEQRRVVAHGSRVEVTQFDRSTRAWDRETIRNVDGPSLVSLTDCLGNCVSIAHGTGTSYAPPSPARLVYLGTATIDGQPTFRIRVLPAIHDASAGTAVARRMKAALQVTFNFWISETTYLPIREVTTQDGIVSSAASFTWLAPSPSNLRLLPVVHAPAGYKYLAWP
jgi:hypothetical protein